MKLRTKVAIIITLILVAIVFLAWPKKLPWEVSEPFATNIAFPHSQDQNKFRYFSGSSFVEYDLTSHKTRRLTPIYLLPTLTEVKWSANGTLFRASGYSPADDLYLELARLGLPDNVAYWWMADFKTGQVTLVGGESAFSVVDAVWGEGASYYYLALPEDDHDSETTIYKASRGAAGVEVATIEKADKLQWADNESVILLSYEDGSLTRLDLNGEGDTINETGVIDASVAPDGKSILLTVHEGRPATEHDHAKGSVYLLNPEGKKVKIANDFAGQIAWSHNSTAFTLVGLAGETPVIISGKVNAKAATYKTELAREAGLAVYLAGQPEQLLFVGQDSSARLAALNKSFSAPQIRAGFLVEEKTVYQNNFYIAYFPEQKSYSVYINGAPFDQKQQEALKYIESQGYDPNQLNLRWYYED